MVIPGVSFPWHQLAWQIFFGFSLSLQANGAVVLQIGHDHFLPRPFQFIIHQPVINGYRYWHSWMVTVFSFCVQCAVIMADWWVGSFDCRQYTIVMETEVCAMYRWKMYILLDDEAVLWGLYSFRINSKLDRDCLQSFVTKADQNMAQQPYWIRGSRQWGCQLTAKMGLTCHL